MPSLLTALRGGFGAEDALEAGAGKVHADVVFAGAGGRGDVDYAALRGEIRLVLARSVVAVRDADFQIAANGYVEAGDKRRAAAA